MIGLLFGIALAGSQAAPEPNPETMRALMRYTECTARSVADLARRTADSAEAVATAATEACREAEDLLQQSMRAQFGIDAANAQLPMMRAYVRGRMMESISEARGGAPVQGEGNEVLSGGDVSASMPMSLPGGRPASRRFSQRRSGAARRNSRRHGTPWPPTMSRSGLGTWRPICSAR